MTPPTVPPAPPRRPGAPMIRAEVCGVYAIAVPKRANALGLRRMRSAELMEMEPVHEGDGAKMATRPAWIACELSVGQPSTSPMPPSTVMMPPSCAKGPAPVMTAPGVDGKPVGEPKNTCTAPLYEPTTAVRFFPPVCGAPTTRSLVPSPLRSMTAHAAPKRLYVSGPTRVWVLPPESRTVTWPRCASPTPPRPGPPTTRSATWSPSRSPVQRLAPMYSLGAVPEMFDAVARELTEGRAAPWAISIGALPSPTVSKKRARTSAAAGEDAAPGCRPTYVPRAVRLNAIRLSSLPARSGSLRACTSLLSAGGSGRARVDGASMGGRGAGGGPSRAHCSMRFHMNDDHAALSSTPPT
eukprot:m.58680 g.58680  ORF g.58680 m.58680 type:complete len:354 (+) comp6919_c0_seq2:806-1867(+)